MQAIKHAITSQKNADIDWRDFDTEAYHHLYGGEELLHEDAMLTQAFIRAFHIHPELRTRFGTADLALDVCMGGVPRNSGLIHPLLRADGRIILADIGLPALTSAESILNQAKKGELGIWKMHQDDMARHDARWLGAIQDACLKSEIRNLSIFDLPPLTFDIIATGFGPESLTEDPDEYQKSLKVWLNSAKPGALAVMFYMVGSTGYMVGDKLFPSFSVQPRDVERLVGRRMIILEHYTVPAAGGVRQESDPTHYDAMAMLLGVVK